MNRIGQKNVFSQVWLISINVFWGWTQFTWRHNFGNDMEVQLKLIDLLDNNICIHYYIVYISDRTLGRICRDFVRRFIQLVSYICLHTWDVVCTVRIFGLTAYPCMCLLIRYAKNNPNKISHPTNVYKTKFIDKQNLIEQFNIISFFLPMFTM